jgi:signal transduction histidine kinase
MEQRSFECLERIVKGAGVMAKIIGDFLDFQAMEDGRISLDLAPLDLNALTKDVIEANREYAKVKEIPVEFVPGEKMPQLSADSDRIRQVVQNFVGNAIKFGPNRSKVMVSTFADGEGVLLEVKDSGPGLTEDDLKRVFRKYARLSNKPTGGEKSSGLGLAICKQLVELHGGQIGVQNNANSGATFWFRLPTVQ